MGSYFSGLPTLISRFRSAAHFPLFAKMANKIENKQENCCLRITKSAALTEKGTALKLLKTSLDRVQTTCPWLMS